jgi:alpha/beta superfamily hydrolase
MRSAKAVVEVQPARDMGMFTRSAAKAAEEPVRFSSGHAELHGMFHGPATGARSAVVLCTPDGEERAWSHRTYVQFGRMLAERGHAVLRFEYMGHGDSTGTYEDATVETRVADTAAAAELLRRRTGHAAPVLIGARLGAVIALEASSHDPRLETLVLWEPILDVEAYLRNLVRINLTSQMVIHKQVVKTSEQLLEEVAAGGRVSANGYHLTKDFVNGLLKLRPAERLMAFPGTALVMTTPVGRMPESAAEVVRFPFAPFWKEPKMDMTPPMELLTRTLDWLDARYPERTN